MLKARNLDDQTYQEIVKAAEGRLPWLCPSWTDHNAHDPGITILELMAWYKELQQYQMNQVTDALRKKLLKLVDLGIELREETSLSSFTAGFKLAWGLVRELEIDGLYSFEDEEEDRALRRIEQKER